VLAHQEVGLFGKLQVRPPFRIGGHSRALARAVGRILEHPEVHERVDVAALPVQVGERRAEMPDLGSEPMLGVEVQLLGHLVRPHGIGAEVDDHV
jgi:hypothetical protein